jgi:hypothetical protein
VKPTKALWQFVWWLLTIAALVGLLSCGVSHGPGPAIMVQFDQNYSPPSSLDTGEYAGIAAVVTNDNLNKGITFNCTPNTPKGACGTFSSASAGSGVPVCYLAPAQVPAQNPVTVTAASVTDPTKFASATINIMSGPGVPCP